MGASRARARPVAAREAFSDHFLMKKRKEINGNRDATLWNINHLQKPPLNSGLASALARIRANQNQILTTFVLSPYSGFSQQREIAMTRYQLFRLHCRRIRLDLQERLDDLWRISVP